MRSRLDPIVPLAVLLLLGACGGRVSAPSLAPRAVEAQPIEQPAVEAIEVPDTADPTLPDQIALLVRAAEEGRATFDPARHRAEVAVAAAAGTPRYGELWTIAQQALSALEVAQSPARDAAAQVENLRQQPAHAGAGDRAMIEAAAQRIESLTTEEAAVVTALSAKLG